MSRRVAFSLFLLLGACQGEHAAPDAIATTSALLPAGEGASGAASGIAEADYRGNFGGANVYATFETHGTIASGSCFYDTIGTPVPLRGAIDDRGVVMLQEIGDKGPVSTITLQRDASGAWFGTWASHDESRSGSARLEPLVRRAGEPVFVATRHIEVTSELCGSMWKTTPCDVSANVPVVLGLGDRAFERTLDAKLASLADIRPPPGQGAKIDYTVPLNARGFVSFEISARWATGGSAAGLTAAVDEREIAGDVVDFVDVPKAHRVRDFLARARSAVLTDRGVAVLDGGAWHELPFGDLDGAMRAGTPFTSAWAR